jgi:hypothetical protein
MHRYQVFNNTVTCVTLPTEGRVNVNQMVISITADVISQRHILILEVPSY